MRQTITCASCGLVQHLTAANQICKRCGKPLPQVVPQPGPLPGAQYPGAPPAGVPARPPGPPPGVHQAPQAAHPGVAAATGQPIAGAQPQPTVPTATGRRLPVSSSQRAKPKGSWVPLAVVGGIAVLAVLIGVMLLPGWLKLEGAPVQRYEDFTMAISFPDGWHHLSVAKGGPNIPHPQTKAFKRTVRGAFYLQRVASPEAVLYFRTEQLAFFAQGGDSDPNKARATAIHDQYRRAVKEMGGSYTPHFSEIGAADPQGYSEVQINRFKGYGTSGEAMISQPFYCWEVGSLYRIEVLWFEMPSRLNWIHVVIPEERYESTWPEVRSLINSIEFTIPKV